MHMHYIAYWKIGYSILCSRERCVTWHADPCTTCHHFWQRQETIWRHKHFITIDWEQPLGNDKKISKSGEGWRTGEADYFLHLQPPLVFLAVLFNGTMSTSSEYSVMVFSKDLPQSSLILDSPVTLSQHLFKNAPRTLFDEMECRKADLQEPSIPHDHTHGPLVTIPVSSLSCLTKHWGYRINITTIVSSSSRSSQRWVSSHKLLYYLWLNPILVLLEIISTAVTRGECKLA